MYIVFSHNDINDIKQTTSELNSALKSCGTGVLSGVIVLAVYVSQINE